MYWLMPVNAENGTLLFQCVSLNVTGYNNLIGKGHLMLVKNAFSPFKMYMYNWLHRQMSLLQYLYLDHSLRHQLCAHFPAAIEIWYICKFW